MSGSVALLVLAPRPAGARGVAGSFLPLTFDLGGLGYWCGLLNSGGSTRRCGQALASKLAADLRVRHSPEENAAGPAVSALKL